MKLNALRADPAGNITLFVLDPIDRGDRAAIAAHLMALPGLRVEQVAFVCPPCEGGDGRMEMMGGEFCGNATRAYGMLLARQRGGASRVMVEASGCEGPVEVQVDLTAETAQARMPLPRAVRGVTVAGHSGVLVDLVGIAHLVVEDVPPSQDFFEQAEPVLQSIPGLEAYGVIFLEPGQGTMTPLVKVPATDTLIWEGSCGSGSLAAAVAQSEGAPDGEFVRDYLQPAGQIRAGVERQAGRVTAAYIGGPVTLDAPIQVEL